jgi:diketogulonate reductase-like aldo/keto reductase
MLHTNAMCWLICNPGRSKTFIEDYTITDLAEKNKTTPAQIVLSWAVHRGTVVVPKSEDKERMLANITVGHCLLPGRNLPHFCPRLSRFQS